tara:strand:- start:18949 stop:19143 length:195 start_codon:yes stop_codon:yes gene_type:complete
VKKEAQKQAEEAFVGFIKFNKYVAYGSILFLLIVARCNFGDDGTGGTGNPDLYPEYLERMGVDE